MKKAGIAIDVWKLDIFKKNLTASGYEFIEKTGVTDDTLLLMVETDNVGLLRQIVAETNKECAEWKKKQELN